MLIGCKIDRSNERQVSKEQGYEFAAFNNMIFNEVSNLTGENVYSSFQILASEMIMK